MKIGYTFSIVVLSIVLISPVTFGVNNSQKIINNINQKITTQISREIEIPADSDYYVKFLSENLSLISEEIEPYSFGLSDKVKFAIAKSPNWIQRRLTRQFHSLENPEEYADLILKSNKKYTDEIAFSIACSPLNSVPSVDLLEDNAFFIYENDKWLEYVEIVDYNDESNNYYSTVRYNIIENGTEKQFEYPKEIYYWYIVHPKTSSENAEYIYGKFWRDYLFNHNDIGYPLLKEKLAKIKYLWDFESYNQPKDRLWDQSIESHPTAIEAISYWIGKTVPAQAIGDRPPQPNIIAHEHNGWCGELQRIAVAAQRTSLIPSIGAYNVAEDHVWREFFERGWHQNDNWWSDGGGAVDKPDVYEYGWGKNMSAVYSWKGDDSIYETTSRYILPEDRYEVKFVVKDIYLQPVDGARVTVLVQGIKDITWTKNKIWEIIEKIWDKLPQIIKGKILQTIYDKIKVRYNEIPDIIDGLTLSVWNYTDSNGECTIELGKGHSYLFVIQHGNLKKFWQLARNNAIRSMPNPSNKTFQVLFLNPFHKVQKHSTKVMPEGNYYFNVSFETESYQLQKNMWYGNIGNYENKGKIDFFVLNEENFEKYKNGEKFDCYNYIEGIKEEILFSAGKSNWYLVFRNHARNTNVIVDFSIKVESSTEEDIVEIIHPYTTILDNPVFNVGDTINISGIVNNDFSLKINNEQIVISPVDYQWFYNWNTSSYKSDDYKITAELGEKKDEILITLIDEIPPEIFINNPVDGEIVEDEVITISGGSYDNTDIEKIEVAIDDSEYNIANGLLNWFIDWDISEFELGKHIVSVKAVDTGGKESFKTIYFIKNESGHTWGPQINSIYHMPENLTNVSNVLIYANVTKANPYDIKSVVLFYKNETKIKSIDMYRYGDNPVQNRHEEDPLFDESNGPIFGFELGQFPNNESITYWIVAYDEANNPIISSEKTFHISTI